MTNKKITKKFESKQDFESVSYTMGIVSIVFAFFSPLAGFVFGIVGLTLSKKQNTSVSKKAKKLNIIGIILSVILLLISVAVAVYFASKGVNTLQNFPAY